MAILLLGGRSPPVLNIIKQHISATNITPALLAAAANNAYSIKPLELLLSFDVKELLSESFFTTVVWSEKAASKLGLLLMLHPVSVNISDAVLCAAAERPWGPGALQWLIGVLEPREPSQAPISAHEAIMWYLHRDPPPPITQEMVVAAAQEPWAGEILPLLLKRDPKFSISEEIIKAVCNNLSLGEHHFKLLLNHNKDIRVSEEILVATKNYVVRESSVIQKFIMEHNDDVDFE